MPAPLVPPQWQCGSESDEDHCRANLVANTGGAKRASSDGPVGVAVYGLVLWQQEDKSER